MEMDHCSLFVCVRGLIDNIMAGGARAAACYLCYVSSKLKTVFGFIAIQYCD